MNENEIYPEDPNEAIDSIDDVEGHGLKEVAAGLGAAAVLAGGAAGATQLASSSVSVHPSTNGSGVSVSVNDPIGTTNDLSDQSIVAAQHTRDGAEHMAINQVGMTPERVSGAKATAISGVDAAGNIIGNTTVWAGDVKQAATNLAVGEAQAVHGTATTGVSAATTIADNRIDSTTTTTGTAVREADRKLATLLSIVTTKAADGVTTATITLKALDANAGANTAQAGGWVLIKDGDKVLAQVQMNGGTATAKWKAPVVGSQTIQVSYTGDSSWAPTSATVHA